MSILLVDKFLLIFIFIISRNQMRKQDVNEKKMPFNDSVKSVEINDPYTHKYVEHSTTSIAILGCLGLFSSNSTEATEDICSRKFPLNFQPISGICVVMCK